MVLTRAGIAVCSNGSRIGRALVASVAPRFQDDQSPEAVREQVEEILSRPEFSYEKSLIERIIGWILEQLAKILPSPKIVDSGATGPGVLAYLVAAVLIVAAIVVIVVALVRLRRRKSKKKSNGEVTDIEATVRENEPDDAWTTEALNLEAAGDWKGAVLVRYRHLVQQLVERELVGATPGLTPGELAREFSDADPGAGKLLDEATVIFEDPWYGDQPVGPAQADRLGAISSEILESPVADSARGAR